MAVIRKQTEETPASYPAVPSGLSEQAQALDPGALWARIEAYTAFRFSEREVIWTVEAQQGEEWEPPLAPVLSHTASEWQDGAWVDLDLSIGPLGLCLPNAGLFRITAQIGAGPTPAPVLEAFKRLAEYAAETPDRAGVSSYSISMGDVSERYERHPSYMARALINSGAADLLRPFRRV